MLNIPAFFLFWPCFYNFIVLNLRMTSFKYFIAAAGFATLASCGAQKQHDTATAHGVNAYVNPFIGTGGHGHTYPGATVPSGMLQVTPVNGKSGWDWVSGYHYSDNRIAGFAHLALSGTGIGDLLDIIITPTNQKINLGAIRNENNEQYPKDSDKLQDLIPYISEFSHEEEHAEPGYYRVFLRKPQVQVEVTSGLRTAMHRYTFKKGDQQSVLLDLGFALNWDRPTSTFIEKSSATEISGYRYSKGWANNQKVYFTIHFSKPIKTFELNQFKNNITSGQFFFDNQDAELLVKVGLSSVSVANARDNIAEHQQKFEFERMKKDAAADWNRSLSKISVETPTDSLKTIFYTALYHAQSAPVLFSDKNGQFRQENDEITTAKNFSAYSTLSLWDTFRAENPLLTVIEPQKTADIINSMLAYYDVRRILPVWTLYGNETNTMTGYHSVPVIAEAYLKGIRGFDIHKAYEAMKATMMGDARGLKDYKQYGYIPYDKLDESVTITLEYAYDDWCVAQIAKALGKTEDYHYFLKRSEAYKHLFDASTGFMRGKSADGKWNPVFDPKHSNHREHTDYTEGNAWQHSWFVIHQPEQLIALHGGREKFTEKLTQLFTESSEITGNFISADITGLVGQYAHGNEPSHHIAYLFNKAGKPWLTQYWLNEIMKTQYNTTPNGLAGNEDCGQMSAWFVMSSIGLYPMNPASGEYEIGRPLFGKTDIKLDNGKTFTIVAENVSDQNMYIRKAILNGSPVKGTSIRHQDIMNGGKLVLTMGSEPNKSGTLN